MKCAHCLGPIRRAKRARYCTWKCYRAAYYLRNKSKYKKTRRDWYEKNRDKVKAYAKQWAENNKDRRKLVMRRYQCSLYGLTLEQYNALYHKQLGRCGICAVKLTKAMIDHCHKTHRVRGLLCGHCNRGLGLFFDKPRLLRKAIAYLERKPQR